MSELIVVNDTYSPDQLAVFAKNNIQYPKMDEIVEFVKKVKYTGGKVGLVVKPYDGQYIKGVHHGVEVEVQMRFDINRFRRLNGDEVNVERVKKSIKEEI